LTCPPTITNVARGGPEGQVGPTRLVSSWVKRGVVAELNEPDFAAVPGGAFRAIVSKGDDPGLETVPGLLLYTIVVGAISVPVVCQVIVTVIWPTTSTPSKFAHELAEEPVYHPLPVKVPPLTLSPGGWVTAEVHLFVMNAPWKLILTVPAPVPVEVRPGESIPVPFLMRQVTRPEP